MPWSKLADLAYVPDALQSVIHGSSIRSCGMDRSRTCAESVGLSNSLSKCRCSDSNLRNRDRPVGKKACGMALRYEPVARRAIIDYHAPRAGSSLLGLFLMLWRAGHAQCRGLGNRSSNEHDLGCSFASFGRHRMKERRKAAPEDPRLRQMSLDEVRCFPQSLQP